MNKSAATRNNFYCKLKKFIWYSEVEELHRKYGVTFLAGITLSLSGTAENIFASAFSAVVNSRILATFPQR